MSDTRLACVWHAYGICRDRCRYRCRDIRPKAGRRGGEAAEANRWGRETTACSGRTRGGQSKPGWLRPSATIRISRPSAIRSSALGKWWFCGNRHCALARPVVRALLVGLWLAFWQRDGQPHRLYEPGEQVHLLDHELPCGTSPVPDGALAPAARAARENSMTASAKPGLRPSA